MLVEFETNPDIVAVIVTLGKNIERLKNCIKHIKKQQTDLKTAILCIHNSPEEISEIESLSDITLIRTGLNLGFSGGLNFARTFIQSKFMWIVQDDMQVHEGCLEALYTALNADKKNAVASPVIISQAGEVATGTCGGSLSQNGEMKYWIPEEPTPLKKLSGIELLDYVPSRGMLIRLEAWDDIGGADSRYYPVIWSDVDLCMAFKKKGWQFLLAAKAIAAHEGQGSTPKSLSNFLYFRNNLLFRAKWFNHATVQNAQANLSMSLRPCAPLSITGTVHDKVDLKLLKIIAQSASDALLHSNLLTSLELKKILEDNKAQAEHILHQTKHIHHIEACLADANDHYKNLSKVTETQAEHIEKLTEAYRIKCAYIEGLEKNTPNLLEKIDLMQQELKELYNSTSWWLTKPVRRLKDFLTFKKLKKSP